MAIEIGIEKNVEYKPDIEGFWLKNSTSNNKTFRFLLLQIK